MNGSRWLAIFLLLAPTVGRGGGNDDSTRAFGKSLAERIVSEASLERGQTVWITWSGGAAMDRRFADGLIEGFMSWGLNVTADRPAVTRHVLSLDLVRTIGKDGQDSYAVRLVSNETNTFVLVKEFTVPGDDESFLDVWGVPLIIAGAASLIVYLLLTVRSS